MQYSSALLIAAFAVTNVFSHGVIDSVKGANGVDMPGLSVADGTPRDCPTPGCGSEADTSIIRGREMGSNKASALGRTQGGGPVDASKMIAMFMGDGGNSTATKKARDLHQANLLRRSLGVRAAGGTKTPKGTVETGVKAAAGAGASSGMPTCSDDGTVEMTFHQVNQDGAGPLKAMVDGTSGGTDPKAFKQADVTTNVPGIGIGGLSAASVMDFPVKAQMPAGTTCDATVAGVDNVCVMKLMNGAAAGPFGGSAAFTQTSAAKKRAIEYNLRKRNFARSLINRRQPAEAVKTVNEAEVKFTKRQQDEAEAALAALKEMGSATNAEDEDEKDGKTKRSNSDVDLTPEEEAQLEKEIAEEEAEQMGEEKD